MRQESRTIDHAVAGVPPALWTSAISQHLPSELNSPRNLPVLTAGKLLLQSDEGERRGYDPAHRARKPWPAVLVGIELNSPIECPKFPFPEPVPFATFRFQKPTSRLLKARGRWEQLTSRNHRKRRHPRSLRVVTFKSP